MNTPKETVLELGAKLPDNATVEDIMYRFYVLTRLEQARREAADGEIIDHEEVEKLMEQWIIA